MDAEEINAAVKSLPNFGGIFDAAQLNRVKILGLPVMLVINVKTHWLGLLIDKEKLEIMDSLGTIGEFMKNEKLCRFICAHLLGKKFLVTPKLQSDNSIDCGKFVVSFLWYSYLTKKSLSDFMKLFGSDFDQNSANIQKIYQTVKAISES